MIHTETYIVCLLLIFEPSCRYLINYVKVLMGMYCKHYFIQLKDLQFAPLKVFDSGFGDLFVTNV